VTEGGASIGYCAVAGTLLVHPKDWDDAAPPNEEGRSGRGDEKPDSTVVDVLRRVFRREAEATARPITFLFNGGPGSATVCCTWGLRTETS